MSTLTPTFEIEERDLLQEISDRAYSYSQETGVVPNAVFLSSELFSTMMVHMMEVNQRPTLNVSVASGRWIEIHTGVGVLLVRELDKYGSDFLFVGRKEDIFPEQGDASLPEKLLLGDTE